MVIVVLNRIENIVRKEDNKLLYPQCFQKVISFVLLKSGLCDKEFQFMGIYFSESFCSCASMHFLKYNTWTLHKKW